MLEAKRMGVRRWRLTQAALATIHLQVEPSIADQQPFNFASSCRSSNRRPSKGLPSAGQEGSKLAAAAKHFFARAKYFLDGTGEVFYHVRRDGMGG